VRWGQRCRLARRTPLQLGQSRSLALLFAASLYLFPSLFHLSFWTQVAETAFGTASASSRLPIPCTRPTLTNMMKLSSFRPLYPLITGTLIYWHSSELSSFHTAAQLFSLILYYVLISYGAFVLCMQRCTEISCSLLARARNFVVCCLVSRRPRSLGI